MIWIYSVFICNVNQGSATLIEYLIPSAIKNEKNTKKYLKKM